MTKNDSSQLNIAILGASGHIGKNLVLYFSKEKKYKLFLYSRDNNKLSKIINDIIPEYSCSINTYNSFDKFGYDVIINCTGISDPYEIKNNGSSIFNITEYYDNKILDYLEKNHSAFYINMSSGAIYGEEFIRPVEDSTYSKLIVNNPTPGNFYSIAKICSETKHRALKHLNITDLRLFGFFSRFIDLDSTFFMSELASSIKNDKTFLTNKIDFIRDFVHPKDLYALVEKCIHKKSINDAIDVYSMAPVSKFEILNNMSQKYDLKYDIKEDLNFYSPTGIKKNYYSLSRKAESIGYHPTYSSIDTIVSEIDHILSM